MRRQVIGGLILALVVVLGGCSPPNMGGDAPPGPPPPPPPPPGPPPPPKPLPKLPSFPLDVPLKTSLADLLGKPRAELARLADELTETIRIHDQKHREGELPYALLPDFRLPNAVPVFRTARYVPARRMSLPPYLEDDAHDRDVALHLARYGDAEAALRLVDPSDAAAVAQINKSKYETNYPLEWVRLVALHQHLAQLRMATGDEEGAQQVVGLHRQLEKVLDPKARGGRLGATLLARGHGALAQAAEAWRKADRKEVAEQADVVLKSWGPVPAFTLALPWGAPQADVARLFAGKAAGYAVEAPRVARALDLLGLPLPGADADAVVACFDADKRLAEVVVVYQPRVTEPFPRPAQLAQLLEDHRPAAKDLAGTTGLRRRTLALPELAADVTVAPHHTAAGALVRLVPTRPVLAPPLGRTFGAVSLDRTFEQNRQLLAPGQRSQHLLVDDPEDLKKVPNPLPALELVEVGLERDAHEDVANRLTLAYAGSRKGLPSLARIVAPLWSAGGPMRLEGGANRDGYYLALVWEGPRTRYALRLPQARGKGPLFEVVDRTPDEDQVRRAREVAAGDRAGRLRRLKEKRPISRISRTWEKVALGMTRAEVDEVLPRGKEVVRRTLPDGLGVVYKQPTEDNPGFIPRELFVRFGPDGRVAEVRVRYTEDPGAKAQTGLDKLLEEIRAAGGAPVELPATWTAVWTDFARRVPAPVRYRWLDDATRLTWQRDSEGAEVAVRDCPPEHEAGVPLPPFQYLPAGPDNCPPGASREDLLKAWKDTKPQFHQGVLILRPPQTSRYDQLQVTFDKDEKVAQVTARHRQPARGNPGPAELALAVQKAWSADLARLGWPRREDYTKRKQVQSWTSHDDRTRVSMFWQEGRSGTARVYTEWKRLP